MFGHLFLQICRHQLIYNNTWLKTLLSVNFPMTQKGVNVLPTNKHVPGVPITPKEKLDPNDS